MALVATMMIRLPPERASSTIDHCVWYMSREIHGGRQLHHHAGAASRVATARAWGAGCIDLHHRAASTASTTGRSGASEASCFACSTVDAGRPRVCPSSPTPSPAMKPHPHNLWKISPTWRIL